MKHNMTKSDKNIFFNKPDENSKKESENSLLEDSVQKEKK